jgi:hypothetical protein
LPGWMHPGDAPCRGLLVQLRLLPVRVALSEDCFMITPAQCRAARALLDWPREWLASESGIGPRSIVDFERNTSGPRSVTTVALRRALEKAGIEFLDDGQGVRLKQPHS